MRKLSIICSLLFGSNEQNLIYAPLPFPKYKIDAFNVVGLWEVKRKDEILHICFHMAGDGVIGINKSFKWKIVDDRKILINSNDGESFVIHYKELKSK